MTDSQPQAGADTLHVSASAAAGELQATVALARAPGVGPRTVQALLEHFPSATAVLAATAADLATVEGIGPQAARGILRADLDEAANHIAFCVQKEIRLVGRCDPAYPAALSRIHDPPIVLYLRGNLLPSDEIAIAMVGARHATQYGLEVADRLARGLSAAGFTIVSGLARGIDQAAHRGALAAGGRTIAVLGSGLLEIYPPEHTDLARAIALQGAVISEADPHHKPRGSSFPQRNRIISGLALGLIVVEAADRSGALISASLATEQGRDVFAVPGRIDSRMSRGCHRLIRDGATLCSSVDDVIEQLGPLAAPVATATGQTMRHPAELKLTEQERTVLNAIGADVTSIDAVVQRSGIPVARVLSTISVLEMRKLVRRVAGGAVKRR